MAKSKKKNNNQTTNVKKNIPVKGKTTPKKTSQTKKKNDLLVEIKRSNQNKNATKKPVNKPITDTQEIKVLTKEELLAQKKEKNRKKYESQQKKYHETKETKPKKTSVVTDLEINEEKTKKIIQNIEPIKKEVKPVKKKTVKPKKEVTVNKPREITIEKPIVELPKEEEVKEKEFKVTDEVTYTEEELVKKAEPEFKTEEQRIQEERKEKRKENLKTPGFTQTLTTIKRISVTKINDVRERANDIHIPIGKTNEEVLKRSKRLISEAVIYAILLTIVNIIVIVCFDYFNFLRLFDVKALNVIVTILISLIFNFFVAFMVDYFVTNVWLVKRRNKKDGDSNANSWINKRKYREDITNKEGE